MSTCNQLDLQTLGSVSTGYAQKFPGLLTLGSQLLMPKNLPDHCMGSIILYIILWQLS